MHYKTVFTSYIRAIESVSYKVMLFVSIIQLHLNVCRHIILAQRSLNSICLYFNLAPACESIGLPLHNGKKNQSTQFNLQVSQLSVADSFLAHVVYYVPTLYKGGASKCENDCYFGDLDSTQGLMKHKEKLWYEVEDQVFDNALLDK